jgi:hypothetical protein
LHKVATYFTYGGVRLCECHWVWGRSEQVHNARSRSCRRPSRPPASPTATRSTRAGPAKPDSRPPPGRAREGGKPPFFFWTDFVWFRCYGPNAIVHLPWEKKGITFVYWAIFGFSIQDSSPGAHIRNTILTGNTWQTAWRLGATVRTRRLHVLAPNVRDNERSVQYRTMHACIHKGGSAEHVVQTEENNADRGSTKAQP